MKSPSPTSVLHKYHPATSDAGLGAFGWQCCLLETTLEYTHTHNRACMHVYGTNIHTYIWPTAVRQSATRQDPTNKSGRPARAATARCFTLVSASQGHSKAVKESNVHVCAYCCRHCCCCWRCSEASFDDYSIPGTTQKHCTLLISSLCTAPCPDSLIAHPHAAPPSHQHGLSQCATEPLLLPSASP